jgi:hypothetical protein
VDGPPSGNVGRKRCCDEGPATGERRSWENQRTDIRPTARVSGGSMSDTQPTHPEETVIDPLALEYLLEGVRAG